MDEDLAADLHSQNGGFYVSLLTSKTSPRCWASRSPANQNHLETEITTAWPFICCPKQVHTSWQMSGCMICIYEYIYIYDIYTCILYMYTNQQWSTHEAYGLQQTPPNFAIFHTEGTASLVFTDPKILFSWWLSIWPTIYEVSIAMTYQQSCIYHAWNTRSKIPPVWRDVFAWTKKNLCRKRRMTFAEGAFCHWCRGREQSD